ncbi:hypothetical protein D3C81_705270 [compost metagenome]
MLEAVLGTVAGQDSVHGACSDLTFNAEQYELAAGIYILSVDIRRSVFPCF